MKNRMDKSKANKIKPRDLIGLAKKASALTRGIGRVTAERYFGRA